eukprot:TRINITY_DN23297_c0_g1_i1.p1 TRINITY_DN23297_c0_g1~~TRINITY_DN23297_c0_g1_i1.p1  ORF type:complete len:928 (-),score=127.92 TRINITY_DN23297_c0_g1_i1:44-2827(-)
MEECDWSSDVCSSDLAHARTLSPFALRRITFPRVIFFAMPRPSRTFLENSAAIDRPPRNRGRSSRTRADENGMETPLRKRRNCHGCGSLESPPRSQPTATQKLAAHSLETRCAQLDVSWRALEEHVIECLAMLDVRAISRSSAVCVGWRQAVRSETLWHLAASHCSLLERVVQRSELTKRRSRGVVEKGWLLGPQRFAVALRTVDLSSANAGLDDGLLPSIVREVALLRSLGCVVANNHCTSSSSRGSPYIARLVGHDIIGKHVSVALEYSDSSFAVWFEERERLFVPISKVRAQIQHRFFQLCRGLAFLHGKGIMHRNLVPANVLINSSTGAVKITDLAHGRSIDVPLRPYSPEDNKLRAQSKFEARRLWYRAPEVLLRDTVYSTSVDVWAVGCLLAEAATGAVLFPSETEVEHLFRVFRFVGTPAASRWPEALLTPFFSAKFPVYEPVDLNAVARAQRGCKQSAAQLRATMSQRDEEHDTAIRCSTVLGPEGISLLTMLLNVDPASRNSIEACSEADFFEHQQDAVTRASKECRAANHAGMEGNATSSNEVFNVHSGSLCESVTSQLTESQAVSLWPEMELLDSNNKIRTATQGNQPLSIDKEPSAVRAAAVDFMVRMSDSLQLGQASLHLAVALFDDARHMHLNRILDQRQEATGLCVFSDASLLATVCLKLADAFDEHSQEYFQREKASAYVHAMRLNSIGHVFSLENIVEAEKQFAQVMKLDIRQPTAVWFLRACLCIGRTATLELPAEVAATARLLLDLGLLDGELQRDFPAPLRAQVALLLAAHAVAARSRAGASAAATAAGTPFAGAEASRAFWARVAAATCAGNRRGPVEACLARFSYIIFTQRPLWAALGFHGVERRHGGNAGGSGGAAAAAGRLAAYGRPPLAALAELLLPAAAAVPRPPCAAEEASLSTAEKMIP